MCTNTPAAHARQGEGSQPLFQAAPHSAQPVQKPCTSQALWREPSGAHEAAGLSAAAGNAELRSDQCAAEALQATLRPFAGNGLRHQPAAGAAGGAPKAHSQGIANQLAAFAGAGRRRGIRLDLDATANQGDAGKQGGAGGVLRIGSDPDAQGWLSLTATKPISQSSDLCGRVVALQQLLHRLRCRRTAKTADQQLFWLLEGELLAELIDPYQTISTTIKDHDQVTTQLPRVHPMPEHEENDNARQNGGNQSAEGNQTFSGKPASQRNARPRHSPPSAQG